MIFSRNTNRFAYVFILYKDRHVDCSVKLKACLLEGIGGTWKIFQSLQASFYICDGFNSD